MSIGNGSGWVYVVWHPKSPRHTKIGFSKWHPFDPDEKYTLKRTHRIEWALMAFGFGPLERWATQPLPNAKAIEKAAHRELRTCRRSNIGAAREIFDIEPYEAIALVERIVDAETD
jgi:hypothetical protein